MEVKEVKFFRNIKSSKICLGNEERGYFGIEFLGVVMVNIWGRGVVNVIIR